MTITFVALSISIGMSQVNDIFIGNFQSFGGDFIHETTLKEKLPNFDTNRLFVWLYHDVPEDTNIFKEDTATFEIYSNIFTSFYSTDSPFVYAGDSLFVGQKLYFYYDKEYETTIEKFIYSLCYDKKCNVYAVCPIPQELQDSDFPWFYFRIICSTS
jgi:hypothetical protein